MLPEEEIREKDWQILTAYSEITALSYLKTIYENQLAVMAKVFNRPLDEIFEESEKARRENMEAWDELIRKNIPLNKDRPINKG